MTAARVMCRPEECLNFACEHILDSLFCRDPDYESRGNTPKHVRKQMQSFNKINTTDVGNKASYKRDTDAHKIIALLKAMLRDQLENVPVLFAGKPFTVQEIAACMDSKTMSANARLFFDSRVGCV